MICPSLAYRKAPFIEFLILASIKMKAALLALLTSFSVAMYVSEYL